MNSVGVAKAIGSVYGADAERAFLPLWRKHIGFVVDYTTGAAAKNEAKQQKAVADLVAYTDERGAFLAAANPNPPEPVQGSRIVTAVSVELNAAELGVAASSLTCSLK